MFTNQTTTRTSIIAASFAAMSLAFAPSALADSSTADWAQEAGSIVQDNMSYPNMAEYRGESGTAYVRVTIDADGDIQRIQLSESSGSKRLDNAAVDTLESIGHFPATRFTSDASTTFTVGMNYVLDDGMSHSSSNTQRQGRVKARDLAEVGSEQTYASIEISTESEG